MTRSLTRLCLLSAALSSLLHLAAPPRTAQAQPAAPSHELYVEGPRLSPSEDHLRLEEVLETIHARHPLTEAARQKLDMARGKSLAADGAFDLQLGVGGELHPTGKKAYGVLDATLMQPTTLWGLRLYAGWHSSYGAIPVYKDQYYHKLDYYFTGYKGTPDPGPLGSVHAGAALPLLRGGRIDKPRAERLSARATLTRYEAELRGKLLDLERKAADSYWSWVAAGQQRLVAQALLQTAIERQKQIEEKVRRGDTAPIYARENQRYILKRERKLVEATQKFDEASVKLSQYWRPDEQATPTRPVHEALRPHWPALALPEEEAVVAAARQAAENLPAVQSLMAEREAAQATRSLYQNELLPRLDLTASAAQPIDPDNKTDIRLTLDFSSPLQRRTARGSLQAAEADLSRIDAELRALQDQMQADVRRAFIGLQGAARRVELAEEEMQIAQELEKAERIRLEAGDSTLLVVNLREQDSADAAMALISARQALQMAYTEYVLSLGTSLLEPR